MSFFFFNFPGNLTPQLQNIYQRRICFDNLTCCHTETEIKLAIPCIHNTIGVSQGQICSDSCSCCHTEIEVADHTCSLIQSQYADTGPKSPCTDLIMPVAGHSSPVKKPWGKAGFEPKSATPQADALSPDQQSGRDTGKNTVNGSQLRQMSLVSVFWWHFAFSFYRGDQRQR